MVYGSVQYDILSSPVLIKESYRELAGSRQAIQNRGRP